MRKEICKCETEFRLDLSNFIMRYSTGVDIIESYVFNGATCLTI